MEPYFLEYYYDGALRNIGFNPLFEILWTKAEYGVDWKRSKSGRIIFGEKKEVIAIKKVIKKELGINPDREGYKLK